MTATQLDLFGSLPKPPLKIREEEEEPDVNGTIASDKNETELPLEEITSDIHIDNAGDSHLANEKEENLSLAAAENISYQKPQISIVPHNTSNIGNRQGGIHVMMPAAMPDKNSTEHIAESTRQDIPEAAPEESKQDVADADSSPTDIIETNAVVSDEESAEIPIIPEVEFNSEKEAERVMAFQEAGLPEVQENGHEVPVETIIEQDVLIGSADASSLEQDSLEMLDETQLEEAAQGIQEIINDEDPTATTPELDSIPGISEIDLVPEIINNLDKTATTVPVAIAEITTAEKQEQEAKGVPGDEDLFKRQYYTMRETAAMFGVNQSLLRFWENEFTILKPKKNKKGDRYFRPADIKNLQLIYHLLKVRKFTIDGARDYLKNNSKALDTFELLQKLEKLKGFLHELTTK